MFSSLRTLVFPHVDVFNNLDDFEELLADDMFLASTLSARAAKQAKANQNLSTR